MLPFLRYLFVMKRNKSTSPRWLVIAIVCLVYVAIVGVVKKHTTPSEKATPALSQSPAAHKPVRKHKTVAKSKPTRHETAPAKVTEPPAVDEPTDT